MLRVLVASLTALVLLSAAGPSTAAPAVTAQPAIAGRLVEQDGVDVLQLWGTPGERGYAHGYLAGSAVLEMLEEALHNTRLMKSPLVYEQMIKPMVLGWVKLPDRYREELAGLLRGISDRVGTDGLRIAEFDRSLDVDDLIVMNCFADWQTMMACSSFSAWGSMTVDGELITGRNLDYHPMKTFYEHHLVIAYTDPGEQRHGWVGLGWPGLIGCYTGMNDAGVTLSIHDVKPLRSTLPTSLMPRTLALREAIELTGGANAVDGVEAVLRRYVPVGGCNVHVSSPVSGQTVPAAILEYDGATRLDQGVSRRVADSTMPEAIYCTNHYRVRRPASPCRRYDSISDLLEQFRANRDRIGVLEAQEVMRSAVATSVVSMQTVYLLPKPRRMGVALATPTEAAPFRPIVWLDVTELLTGAGK